MAEKDTATETELASPASGEVAAAPAGAESSAATAVVKPDSTTGTDGTAGVKEPGTALEALFKARDKIAADAAKPAAGAEATVGASPDSESAGKPKADDTDAKAKAAADGETEQAKKDAPARVKELLAERKEIMPRAEAFDQLVNWVHAANLTQDDFNTALEIGRLMKNDPHEAFKRIQPIYAQLQAIVGEVLPADLVEKVTNGVIDEATARELAQARSRATIAETGRKRVVEQTAAEREAQDQAAHVHAIARSVSVWEADWKKSDADYQRKSPFVASEIQALMSQEGYPRTPEEAVEQATRAKKIVEARLSGLMPAPKGRQVVTGGSHSGSATPQPKTSLEAMRLAAPQARNAA